jgi:hypothetical protein
MTLILGLLLSHATWHAVLIPLTVTALILTIAYNPQFALNEINFGCRNRTSGYFLSGS